jgi:hypothetical protein
MCIKTGIPTQGWILHILIDYVKAEIRITKFLMPGFFAEGFFIQAKNKSPGMPYDEMGDI